MHRRRRPRPRPRRERGRRGRRGRVQSERNGKTNVSRGPDRWDLWVDTIRLATISEIDVTTSSDNVENDD
ncbi:hypothetical protein WN48_03205 [Eufriesea mexicana]|nr:hypothetical protein WN48_03205 [Eufriesea mexicana]